MWCKLLGGSAEYPWKMFDVKLFYKNAQGLRRTVKLLVGHSGQVDFPARQVTFHSHLPDGQEPWHMVCHLQSKPKLSWRAACPKDSDANSKISESREENFLVLDE